MNSSANRPAARRPSGLLLALAVLALALLAGLGGWLAGRRGTSEADLEQAARSAAQQRFEPVLSALAEAHDPKSAAYDIDHTVLAIQMLDQALERTTDLDVYLGELAHFDWRQVAPEVLETRSEVLGVLLELQARQREEGARAEAFGYFRYLGQALGLARLADFELPLVGGVGFDQQAVQTLLEDVRTREERNYTGIRQLAEVENRLLAALVRQSEVHWKYLDEWDQLCLVRDQAWLATFEGDWPRALSAARAAIALAPSEGDAHLLEALALIQGQGLDSSENPAVLQLLGAYKQAHASRSAPALLLEGLWHARRGEQDEARLLLEQSAAWYPKQAELARQQGQLRDLRPFLQRSRPGNAIRELDRSTWVGASWFSPELQLAQLDFDQGRQAQGRERIRDHFARRRAQGDFDLLLYDLEFCNEILGEDYRWIFPEDVYLDLLAEPATFGGGFNLELVNRSQRELHNATLVLCLSFTDLHPEDFVTLRVDPTQPVVRAGESTDFGQLKIDWHSGEVSKGLSDVVPPPRAILIANEAVVWVDTVDFKAAEASAARERRAALERPLEGGPSAGTWNASWDELEQKLRGWLDLSKLELEFDRGLLRTDLLVRLPRELAVLRPSFALLVGDQRYAPDENRIEGAAIRLAFHGRGELLPKAGGANAKGEPLPAELALEVSGLVGAFEIVYTLDALGQRWRAQRLR